MLTRCPPRLANRLALGDCGVVFVCDGEGVCAVAASLAAVMSGLLLLQNQLRSNEIDQRKAHKDEHIDPQVGKAECLIERPNADRLEPSRRKCQPDEPPLPRQGGHRNEQTGEVHRRYDRENSACEDRRYLCLSEGRDELSKTGGREHVEQRPNGEG